MSIYNRGYDMEFSTLILRGLIDAQAGTGKSTPVIPHLPDGGLGNIPVGKGSRVATKCASSFSARVALMEA
jgi:hypothetical protein